MITTKDERIMAFMVLPLGNLAEQRNICGAVVNSVEIVKRAILINNYVSTVANFVCTQNPVSQSLFKLFYSTAIKFNLNMGN